MPYDYPTAFCSWHDPRGDGGHEERAAIDRVMASGRYTMGAEVEAFEDELGAYLGRRHAVMVNSGSSANLVAVAALRALNPSVGMAQVPAVAWATTYAPLAQHSFELRVRDVEPSWNAYPTENEHFLDLLVFCPVLGNPLDGDRARATLSLEDACESLGAVDAAGRASGTLGDASTLSFYWSHQLSAIEGGAVVTDDDELARLCRMLRNHGNNGWGSPEFETSYDFRVFGYNLRPLEQHAAIAREQLRKLGAMVPARTQNAALFRSLTEDLPVTHPVVATGSRYAPFGLPFCVPSPWHRRKLVAALWAAGVDCRLPTGGSFLRHAYSRGIVGSTPNADQIHDTGLFLGCAPFPIPDLIERAVRVMRETL
jgi:CDP-6-deoxy-D-xylo-4-hexulose-3-dehydrase